jgi:hypothetical protein
MQLEKVPYKWFSAMCCEGYSVPGPMIIKKKKTKPFFVLESKLEDRRLCTE